jgi:hypothetical protein
MARNVARLASVLTLALLAGAIVIGVRWVLTLPPESSPFASLDLERPIGWATEMQFDRMRDDPALCAATLAASRIEAEPIEDTVAGAHGQCGYRNAVNVMQSTLAYSNPVRVSCPLAAALYVWEREVIMPAAARLESPVARIELIGTYACRNIYGRSEGRVSEHATANAVDIAGFRLENGRVVSVLRGWEGGSVADAAFLREVRDGACPLFQGVLSPDYNAAHRDHLHLDMGPYGICS